MGIYAFFLLSTVVIPLSIWTVTLKQFNIQLTLSYRHNNYWENSSTCWHWHCCCHHPAHHLGGVWTPPPTLHTHSTWAWWIKAWLLTLVEYHWAHSGAGVLHNHFTGCNVGISTVNITSCMGTTNKWLRHFRKESDGYLVITNDFWKFLWRTDLSVYGSSNAVMETIRIGGLQCSLWSSFTLLPCKTERLFNIIYSETFYKGFICYL